MLFLKFQDKNSEPSLHIVEQKSSPVLVNTESSHVGVTRDSESNLLGNVYYDLQTQLISMIFRYT